MDKKTTTNLRNEIDRKIDVNGNLISDDLLLDFANDAQDDLLQIIREMHKEGLIAVEWSKELLKYGTFNAANQINLPDDYLIWIKCRLEGDSDSRIEIVREEDLTSSEFTGQDICAIYAGNVTAPVANSGNTGSDGFEVRGKFTGAADTTYQFEIEAGGATFQWTDDAGATYTTGVSCATTWIDIANGIRVKFGSASGHTAGDIWDISAYITKNVQILECNFNPSANLDFFYADVKADLAVVGATTYIPYPQFYRAFRYLVEVRCHAYNEERLDVGAAINQKTIKRARELIRDMNSPETLKLKNKWTWNKGYR